MNHNYIIYLLGIFLDQRQIEALYFELLCLEYESYPIQVLNTLTTKSKY